MNALHENILHCLISILYNDLYLRLHLLKVGTYVLCFIPSPNPRSTSQITRFKIPAIVIILGYINFFHRMSKFDILKVKRKSLEVISHLQEIFKLYDWQIPLQSSTHGIALQLAVTISEFFCNIQVSIFL